jgi:hypothetical protein
MYEHHFFPDWFRIIQVRHISPDFCDFSHNFQGETTHYQIADRNEGHGG